MSFYKKVPGLQRTLESELLFDKEPKAGSTNPVTSDGVANGINGALNDVVGKEYSADFTIENPTKEYEVGKFYFIDGTICSCTSYSASEAEFALCSVCDALNILVDAINE